MSETEPSPYATLRQAYARRDAVLAAAAYAPGAEFMDESEWGPPAALRGREAITAAYARLFRQLDPADALDLNFRIEQRTTAEGRSSESGLYRLRSGGAVVATGRFQVTREPHAPGLIHSERRHAAPAHAFEEAAGPVLLAVDEELLDPGYYDALTGRYALPNGCDLVVTRSFLRLFVRDTCSGAWRGLQRVSGRRWTAGAVVLPTTVEDTCHFAEPHAGQVPALTVIDARGAALTAQRRDRYRAAATTFRSQDGTRLAGTLYQPLSQRGACPAAVLVHGSGAQDRHGFASIIDVLADELASLGFVVLTYDKRGVGESAGDWSRAGFAVLAQDAAAAMDHVAALPTVDAEKLVLAGSSQAGWVIAAALAQGARPAGVFLLGAAGSALTVAEQNLYNTGVRMRCAGFKAQEIVLALAQQEAFFRFLRDPQQAAELDRLTRAARQQERLREWLFPSSTEAAQLEGAWFTTLEVDFDPLPVWAAYRGRAAFVFAEHDDATPTDVAVARLRGLGERTPPRLTLTVLSGAQHLGLSATSVCAAELSQVARFHPDLFPALARFARDVYQF